MRIRSIPCEARDTLASWHHTRSQEEYTDLIWRERVSENTPVQRARSKTWPPSLYDKKLKGYVLPLTIPSNVTQLRKRKT